MISCPYVLHSFFVVDVDERVLFFDIEPFPDAMRLVKPRPKGFVK